MDNRFRTVILRKRRRSTKTEKLAMTEGEWHKRKKAINMVNYKRCSGNKKEALIIMKLQLSQLEFEFKNLQEENKRSRIAVLLLGGLIKELDHLESEIVERITQDFQEKLSDAEKKLQNAVKALETATSDLENFEQNMVNKGTLASRKCRKMKEMEAADVRFNLLVCEMRNQQEKDIEAMLAEQLKKLNYNDNHILSGLDLILASNTNLGAVLCQSSLLLPK